MIAQMSVRVILALILIFFIGYENLNPSAGIGRQEKLKISW